MAEKEIESDFPGSTPSAETEITGGQIMDTEKEYNVFAAILLNLVGFVLLAYITESIGSALTILIVVNCTIIIMKKLNKIISLLERIESK